MITQNLMEVPDAVHFKIPVPWKDLGIIDYPEIIKRPMDLGTI